MTITNLTGNWILFSRGERWGEILEMIGDEFALVEMTDTDAPAHRQLISIDELLGGYLFVDREALDKFLAWANEPASGPKIVAIGGGEKDSI